MKRLAEMFHQDCMLSEESVIEIASIASHGMRKDERLALADVVEKALTEDDTLALRNPFRRAGAEVFVGPVTEFWSDVLVGLKRPRSPVEIRGEDAR